MINNINKFYLIINLITIFSINLTQSAAIIQTTKKAPPIDLRLILAASNGDNEEVKRLIGVGANVNAADKWGDTALLLAAKTGNKKTVELLIEKGANVNAEGKLLDTALIWAAIYGDKEKVKLLLRAGSKIEHKNKDGDMAINLAPKEIVKMLENEQSRREAVVKKWIKENLYKKITESTSGILIPDISKLISEYHTIEYTDLPLEYRLNS